MITKNNPYQPQRVQLSLTVLLLVLGLLILASINFPYGYNEDSDGYLILAIGRHFNHSGYVPSRAWGYPLYDLFVYPLLHYFGLTSAKLYALLWSTISVIVFFRTIFLLTQNPFQSFIGSVCFLVHPLTITSSNLLMETSQGVALAILGLYFYARFLQEKKTVFLYLLFLSFGLATATRMEYVVLTFSLALALLRYLRFQKKQIVVAVLIYFVVAASPYLLLYGVKHFSHFPFILGDPLPRKIARVFFGYLALLGLPAFLVFVFCGKTLFRKNEREPFFLKQFHSLFLCAFILYTLMYVNQPAKLEYVYILIPLFILCVMVHCRKRAVLFLFLAAFALPNVAQIHFFHREKENIKVDIGFSPGAIVQDRSQRLRIEYLYSKQMKDQLKSVAERFQCENYVNNIANRLPVPQEKLCAIIPEQRLRFWNEDRLPNGKSDREKIFKTVRIIVYPLLDNKAWKQFFKFTPWRIMEPHDFKVVNPGWGPV